MLVKQQLDCRDRLYAMELSSICQHEELGFLHQQSRAQHQEKRGEAGGRENERMCVCWRDGKKDFNSS